MPVRHENNIHPGKDSVTGSVNCRFNFTTVKKNEKWNI